MVVADSAAVLRNCDINKIYGDRFGGEFVAEAYRRHGIGYDAIDKSKSELFGELLILLNAGTAELLDDTRLAAQLCSLERNTARSGRDSIAAPKGGKDDISNAVAGSLWLASKEGAPALAAPSAFLVANEPVQLPKLTDYLFPSLIPHSRGQTGSLLLVFERVRCASRANASRLRPCEPLDITILPQEAAEHLRSFPIKWRQAASTVVTLDSLCAGVMGDFHPCDEVLVDSETLALPLHGQR